MRVFGENVYTDFVKEMILKYYPSSVIHYNEPPPDIRLRVYNTMNINQMNEEAVKNHLYELVDHFYRLPSILHWRVFTFNDPSKVHIMLYFS